MKIAIIGANGFVGSRLVESLHLDDTATVIPITHAAAGHALAARFALDLRIADALDIDALSKALAGCSAAISAVRVPPSAAKRLGGSIARAAARAGVRKVVYLSAADVLSTESGGPHAPDGDSPSALAAGGERQFVAECRRGSVNPFILRPGLTYGPRSGFFATTAAELRDRTAWLLGNGDMPFNGVYVDNLVTAIRLCLRAKTPASAPLPVYDAEAPTWRELLVTMARELDLSASSVKLLGSPAEITAPLVDEAAGWSRSFVQQKPGRPALGQTEKLLNYRPTTSFAEGIRRSCAWLRFSQGHFERAA